MNWDEDAEFGPRWVKRTKAIVERNEYCVNRYLIEKSPVKIIPTYLLAYREGNIVTETHRYDRGILVDRCWHQPSIINELCRAMHKAQI